MNYETDDLRSEHCLVLVPRKQVTDFNMAANRELYNSVYEQVRLLGLPYEIKETGGSVVIKISADIKQQSFNKEMEKFRFHNRRTLNGSSNSNWRSPESFNKKYVQISADVPSFPNLKFFQRPFTPPPAKLTASRPPAATSDLLVSSNQT